MRQNFVQNKVTIIRTRGEEAAAVIEGGPGRRRGSCLLWGRRYCWMSGVPPPFTFPETMSTPERLKRNAPIIGPVAVLIFRNEEDAVMKWVVLANRLPKGLADAQAVHGNYLVLV